MKIHLQSIGEVEAIQVKDIKPGIILLWNFGYTSKVVSVENKGKSSKIITERDGKQYTRTLRNTTLLGIKK